MSALERDYPELKVDLSNANGDISGRALRLNRAPAEAKVLQRRPNYDNAIVRVQQMAVAIAGYRGYDDFNGFGLDSYAAGTLDHSIGDRPVFGTDPLDKLEENKEFWGNAKLAKEAGVPLVVYLKESGWTDEKIKTLVESTEYSMRIEAQKNALEGSRMAFNEGAGTRKVVSDNNIDDNADDPQDNSRGA